MGILLADNIQEVLVEFAIEVEVGIETLQEDQIFQENLLHLQVIPVEGGYLF